MAYVNRAPGIVNITRGVTTSDLCDYPQQSGSVATAKTITGIIRSPGGAVVVGATVLLHWQISATRSLVVATATTNGSGSYTFSRDVRDDRTYFVSAYSVTGGSTQIHGTSDRGLLPT